MVYCRYRALCRLHHLYKFSNVTSAWGVKRKIGWKLTTHVQLLEWKQKQVPVTAVSHGDIKCKSSIFSGRITHFFICLLLCWVAEKDWELCGCVGSGGRTNDHSDELLCHRWWALLWTDSIKQKHQPPSFVTADFPSPPKSSSRREDVLLYI